MRKSFKFISFLVICLLFCGVLMACSAPKEDTEQNGAASVEGKWLLTSVTTEDGETIKEEELTAAMGEIYYEFQSGGKFVMGVNNEEALGEWEQTGAEVTFSSNGETFSGVVDGDTFTTGTDGGTSVFTRA